MRAVTAALMAQVVLAGVVATPASAQPASACAGGRQFVVYFPANLSLIPTQGGQAVVAAAASYAAKAPSRLVVTGHTDAVEPDVSAARAEAAKAALMGQGISAGQITVAALGSQQLAVPSDRAEPLNRRVTICVAPG